MIGIGLGTLSQPLSQTVLKLLPWTDSIASHIASICEEQLANVPTPEYSPGNPSDTSPMNP